MTFKEIANRRLKAQLLSGGGGVSAREVVIHMGAIQAQDFSMSKWAVGVRSGLSEEAVTQALEAGDLIRTHVLRPTWHLVAAGDVRWMLELTSPGVKRAFMGMSRTLGMDDKFLAESNKKIARLLCKGNAMTREEIMSGLKFSRDIQNDIRPSLIMMNAEQDAVVCNGPMKGKDITYMLMDARVPEQEKLTRDEMLARLAYTYFNSHGPATVADFAWWSGLGVNDARRGAASVSAQLESATVDGLTWYFTDHGLPQKREVYLLPAFDEYLVSYKDREASIALSHQSKAFTKNGIFRPVIVDSGKVVGTWKREMSGNRGAIEATVFEDMAAAKYTAIMRRAAVFATFLQRELAVEFR
ncbi:MAG: AlkZ family DNA glycosylase [Taibaiella sp.]|nr:AlkZ family DNA glycosylase [Taibaiella sp.]